MEITKQNLQHLLVVVSLAATSLLMVGCGGGGGDSGGSESTGGSDNNNSSTVLNAGLTGKFVYRLEDDPRYYTTEAVSGVETLLLRRPTHTSFMTPSPDRKFLLFQDTPGSENRATLSLYDGTKPFEADQPIYTTDFDRGFPTRITFSADSRYVAIRYRQGVGDDKRYGFVIFDLANPAQPVLLGDSGLYQAEENPDKYVSSFNWLPNGEFIYKLGNNQLIRGDAKVAGGNKKIIGTLKAPEGLAVSEDIEVSPDGTQLAATFLGMAGDLQKRDVWIGNIDGSQMERLTDDGFSIEPMWSPDGQFIAMKSSAGHQCTVTSWEDGGGVSCNAMCERWYVPKTARNAKLNTADPKMNVRVHTTGYILPVTLSCARDVYWTK